MYLSVLESIQKTKIFHHLLLTVNMFFIHNVPTYDNAKKLYIFETSNIFEGDSAEVC